MDDSKGVKIIKNPNRQLDVSIYKSVTIIVRNLAEVLVKRAGIDNSKHLLGCFEIEIHFSCIKYVYILFLACWYEVRAELMLPV